MRNPLAILPQRLRRRMPSALRLMAEMEDEMDRLFQSTNGLAAADFEAAAFSPSCDLNETNSEFILSLDIPGIKKNDVKIEIANNRLTVSGERTEKKEEKDARSFVSESYFGSFMRSFDLPSDVNEDKVDAHYEDGVLTIKVPKLQIAKAKEIKVS
jgi:HSP20 family protein